MVELLFVFAVIFTFGYAAYKVACFALRFTVEVAARLLLRENELQFLDDVLSGKYTIRKGQDYLNGMHISAISTDDRFKPAAEAHFRNPFVKNNAWFAGNSRDSKRTLFHTVFVMYALTVYRRNKPKGKK